MMGEAEQVSFAVGSALGFVDGVSVAELFGPCSLKNVVRARHIAWAILYEATEMSPADIGRHFDRHRTSVRDGIFYIRSDDDWPSIRRAAQHLFDFRCRPERRSMMEVA